MTAALYLTAYLVLCLIGAAVFSRRIRIAAPSPRHPDRENAGGEKGEGEGFQKTHSGGNAR